MNIKRPLNAEYYCTTLLIVWNLCWICFELSWEMLYNIIHCLGDRFRRILCSIKVDKSCWCCWRFEYCGNKSQARSARSSVSLELQPSLSNVPRGFKVQDCWLAVNLMHLICTRPRFSWNVNTTQWRMNDKATRNSSDLIVIKVLSFLYWLHWFLHCFWCFDLILLET